jgi:hypothetical protein
LQHVKLSYEYEASKGSSDKGENWGKENYSGLMPTEKLIVSLMLADKRLTAEVNILLERRIKFGIISPVENIRFKLNN